MKNSLLRGLAIIGLSTGLVGANSSYGQELTPAAKLRKLSLHIRGLTPSTQDYEELALQALKQSDLNIFMETKTKEYLRSPEHVAKMSTRLDELFRLKPADSPPEKYFIDILKDSPPRMSRFGSNNDVFNSADFLFRKIIAEDLSWDHLITGSDYTTFVPSYDSVPGSGPLQRYSPDLEFLEALLEGRALKTQVEYNTLVHLTSVGKTDARLAGAVTTFRFLQRYTNSTTNRSRKRAAAVFNIFLCDEMRPVIVSTEKDDREALAQAFAVKRTPGGPSAHAIAIARGKMSEEAKHGRDPMCMSCHYKLDPLAKSFAGIGDVLPEEGSRGALVFKREDGSMVNIPGNGLGDLGRALVRQPEYARCQVKHFWNWFVGKDVVLKPKRLEELVRKFNEFGRRPNRFVSYLVNQPEFYTLPAAVSPLVRSYRRAEVHLKECSTCHSMSIGPDPFLPLPIGGSLKNHRQWIDKIAASLDLPNNGKNAEMPPDWSGWDPGEVKIATVELKDWICLGAPDRNGNPTINVKELQEGVCPK